MISACLWMFFSQALYVTERMSYDQEMVDTYGSMMRSPWAEIINLHGEWPWADYTSAGKGIATPIALVGIMIFCVPIGIFGEGFRARVEKDSDPVDANFDRRCWQARCRPQEPGLQ